jgi:hypothetical protein
MESVMAIPPPLSSLIAHALQSATEQLRQLASDATAFSHVIETAFGSGTDASGFKKAWETDHFTHFPAIKIRGAAEINGANGTFAAATNTIYLAQEFVAANLGNPKAITSVLLEELKFPDFYRASAA